MTPPTSPLVGLRRRVTVGLAVAGALVVGTSGGWAAGSPSSTTAAAGPTITVLSSRPDLVTGGDALVRIALPQGADASGVKVAVDGRDVTAGFRKRASGAVEGLATGLRKGANTLTATLRDGSRARLTLTSHPSSGPLVAGAQVQPWVCDTTGAADAVGSMQPLFLGPSTDAACSTPVVTRLFYLPVTGGTFLAYDPASTPASLVATTTTQTGVTMPFIVRVEEGVQDRGIYAVAVLYDAAKPWTPFAPQKQWNGKVLSEFGGGDAPSHVQGRPQSVMDEHALGLGWMVAGSGLNVLGFNDNPVVSSEALMMLKEHIVETYGPVRFTVGSGCSGGGLLQDHAAGQYPGLLDGLLVACNYLDIWSTAPEVVDCYLLDQYLTTAPQDATAVQTALGHKDLSVCQAWDATFAPVLDPSNEGSCDLPAAQVYDPATNPAGVRCTIQDYGQSLWGQRPRTEWTAQEKKIGRGFAPLPQSNVGVPYGMEGLAAGTLTPAQFVSINAGVGGVSIDGQVVDHRTGVDRATLATAYRTGQVTDARQLAKVPIIDLRAGSNEAEIHTPVHSQVLRARLDAQAGSHANDVLWTFAPSAPIVGVTPPREVADSALDTMDAWLTTIERKGGFGSPARVAASKPAKAVDTCYVGVPSTAYPAPPVPVPTQVAITDPARCAQLYPTYSAPRFEAGAPLTNLVVSCTLKPLARQDFPGAFTNAQWSALQATFPSGVCDYSRPGVGQQRSVPWQTYAGGPGGRPLGPVPTSERF